jgi:hypothetical protein
MRNIYMLHRLIRYTIGRFPTSLLEVGVLHMSVDSPATASLLSLGTVYQLMSFEGKKYETEEKIEERVKEKRERFKKRGN